MSRVKPSGRVPRPARATLRQHLEAFDRIDVVSDDMRGIVQQEFPDLLGKLPPRKPRARSATRRRKVHGRSSS